MRLRDRLERLEAKREDEIYSTERWLQVEPEADLFSFKDMNLTGNELDDRSANTPGLCVIRVRVIYD